MTAAASDEVLLVGFSKPDRSGDVIAVPSRNSDQIWTHSLGVRGGCVLHALLVIAGCARQDTSPQIQESAGRRRRSREQRSLGPWLVQLLAGQEGERHQARSRPTGLPKGAIMKVPRSTAMPTARHEQILPSAKNVESLDAVNAAPDRRLRNRKGSAVRLQPNHRVAFVAHTRKVPVVDPFPLQEFERGHRFGADEEEKDAARHLIIFL